MSWLKLTAGHLYLMKGGSDQYIDKVKIDHSSVEDEKIQGSIKEFPQEWFTSASQRPKTIIVNLEEERDGVSRLDSFSKVQILRRFEIPVSYQFFEELKTSTKISQLIKKFEEVVGMKFSDEFLNYTNSAGKTWKIVSSIKYSRDFEIESCPMNPTNPNDPDADEEEPPFATEVFLPVIWSSGFTIKPYLTSNPEEDSTIRIELRIEQPRASLSLRPVSIATLEKAVKPQTFTRKDENKIVKDVLQQLSDKRGIAINASPDMQGSNAEFNFSGQLTLTDVMDTIASTHGAFWDWQGDSAFIRRTIPS